MRRSITLFAILFVMQGQLPNHLAAADQLSATQILSQMLDKYRNCQSYRDTGINKVIYHSQDEGDRTDESPFKTTFVRPNRFRLEYGEVSGEDRTKKRPYIFWTNGTDTRKWRDVAQEEEKPESLATALLYAHGSTFHTSTTVPTFLDLTTISWFPPSTDELKKLPDERLGEVDCFRIQTTDLKQNVRTLWIAKDTYLLRRFDVLPPKSPTSGFWFEVSMTYEPSINESIPDKELEFK